MSKAEWESNEEIKIFREYLRIPTVHPNVDYSKFVNIEVWCLSTARKRSQDKPSLLLFKTSYHKDKMPTFYSRLCGILKASGSQLVSACGCALSS